MNIHLSAGPLVSLLAGILILIVPRLLNSSSPSTSSSSGCWAYSGEVSRICGDGAQV